MSEEPVLDSEVLAYYDLGRGRSRLETNSRLEYLRTRELLGRFLPGPPARILDVGGGTGAYAVPLIEAGYDKHGIGDTDMIHAFNHPILVDELDDGFTMFVGADPAANLLEIGVVDTSDGPIIIHAMPARPKYLR